MYPDGKWFHVISIPERKGYIYCSTEGQMEGGREGETAENKRGQEGERQDILVWCIAGL